jgi:hypothetical protein
MLMKFQDLRRTESAEIRFAKLSVGFSENGTLHLRVGSFNEDPASPAAASPIDRSGANAAGPTDAAL